MTPLDELITALLHAKETFDGKRSDSDKIDWLMSVAEVWLRSQVKVKER
jgi:hypothetical protein